MMLTENSRQISGCRKAGLALLGATSSQCMNEVAVLAAEAVPRLTRIGRLHLRGEKSDGKKWV